MADEPQQPPPQPQQPPNAAAVIAAQQAAVQQQIAEARQRDQQQFGTPVQGADVTPVAPLGGALQAQAQAQQAQAQQIPAAQQVIGNIPQGLTAQQLGAGIPQTGPSAQQQQIAALQAQLAALQGAPQQPQVQAVPPQPVQSQLAQHAPKAPSNKPTVRWHPGRNSSLNIELTDVILAGIPDDIRSEPDPQAKMVAVMLSEILALRARVSELEGGAGGGASPDLERRVGMLEMTLLQQTQALSQGARAAREEAVRQLMTEQAATAGQPGGTPVVDPAAQPQPDIKADPGQ